MNHFRSIYSILKPLAIMLTMSSSKNKTLVHNLPTNTPDSDNNKDITLLKRQILELKASLN